jgi:ElaA protein
VSPTIHVAGFDELTAATLYALVRLRIGIFVVEQNCPYPELDGRDTEPGTRHVWVADGDRPLAYLRVLADPDGRARIGRVCVAAEGRGAGLARRLMAVALDLIGDRPSALDAQSYLVDFYAGFGYRPAGPEYIEDGIPHVPMHRTGSPDQPDEPDQGSAATISATERRRPV